MTQLEIVLNGIEEVKNSGIQCPLENIDPRRCFYFPEKLIDDIVFLLKAQEPRVMTLCEIQSFDGAVYVDEPNNPVCLKMLYCYEVGQRTYGHGYTFVDSDGDRVFYSAQGHGTKWRCWTYRPTNEQRRAVKWE